MNTRSYSKVSNHSVKRQQRYNPYPLNRRTSFTENHFQTWKNRINTYVYQKIGWNLDDLPDQPYRLWFDDGYLKPSQVACVVLGDFYQLYNLNQVYFN